MKIVDLFSGLGGMTIGCIQASYALNVPLEIAFACDASSSCSNFYRHNFHTYIHNYYEGDILNIEPQNLIYDAPIDYLFAGPPCQGHSDLNNSTRRDDPRNLLYLETLKLINHFNPNVFVIENVPTVVHSKERVVEQLSRHLKGKYSVEEYVVDFLKLGIAQTRKRHILVGSRVALPENFLNRIYAGLKQTNLRQVIGDLEEISSTQLIDVPSRMMPNNKNRVDFLFDNNLYDLPNSERPKCHQGDHSYKSMYGRLNWDKPAQTITGGFGSMGQGRFVHPSKKRVITPREAARIQGLPDWLDYSKVPKRGDIQQMIGNVVPPILSKQIILEMEGYNEK
ncbi:MULTISPECIES: DNA cytosine methyltransferase [unclassified Pseudoalteromonas]|uniref:DNA cytosine methyltransferase n=1 Tax=unclassified Pseudoalteromonas TaxID=194690 RepID=UPI00110B1762|nr:MULTISPECIES: DNA cytosine methyltransferase [unclassified Pseudoalteromonas]TMP46843.1 DNA cytosine methyltransferase [Pseudoalteromonas sp. S1650]TMP70043.1 DNA cytosine methyltransferase [Pseudoalteromonas sp. S1649]